MESSLRKLGNYISEIDERNVDGHIENLLGVSITKEFIPSVANTIGTDLTKYKVIRKGQFACSLMQVSRDGGIAISLYKNEEPAIMSPAYYIFDVDESKIDPEYLELIVNSTEFDRAAVFYAVGGVRGTLTWEDFCKMSIVVPEIKEQTNIVRQCKAIRNRISILSNINNEYEKLISTHFNYLFADETNYDGCSTLGELTDRVDNRGKTPPNTKDQTEYPLLEIASLKCDGRILSYLNCEKYVDQHTYDSWFRSGHPKQYDILFSTVGSIANFKLFMGDKGCIAQNIVGFRCKDKGNALFLYQSLLNKINDILAYEIGSVQASIKVSQVINLEIEMPEKNALAEFNKLAIPVTDAIFFNTQEIERCILLEKGITNQII